MKTFKLWVDDIRPAPEGWELARTITQAITFIAEHGQSITHISLDHDISHNVIVDNVARPFPSEENFTPVAYFIGSFYTEAPKVTIHSANKAGAKEMKEILANYGINGALKPLPPCNRYEENK